MYWPKLIISQSVLKENPQKWNHCVLVNSTNNHWVRCGRKFASTLLHNECAQHCWHLKSQFPQLFSFLNHYAVCTQKPPSPWTSHLIVLLYTVIFAASCVSCVCAEMTALHLKTPHQLHCCLQNPFEIQQKPAHPQPNTRLFELRAPSERALQHRFFWSGEWCASDFLSSSVPL